MGKVYVSFLGSVNLRIRQSSSKSKKCQLLAFISCEIAYQGIDASPVIPITTVQYCNDNTFFLGSMVVLTHKLLSLHT